MFSQVLFFQKPVMQKCCKSLVCKIYTTIVFGRPWGTSSKTVKLENAISLNPNSYSRFLQLSKYPLLLTMNLTRTWILLNKCKGWDGLYKSSTFIFRFYFSVNGKCWTSAQSGHWQKNHLLPAFLYHFISWLACIHICNYCAPQSYQLLNNWKKSILKTRLLKYKLTYN